MNAPIEPTDPFLQILTGDAADLPLKAASEARQARADQAKRHRQMMIAAMLFVCSAAIWPFFPRGQIGPQSVATHAPEEAPIASPKPSVSVLHSPEPPSPLPRELALVQTKAQAMDEPQPLPDGLTEEQASVVEAARGLPLLLVRDTMGKVAYIHVIER